MSRDAIFSKFDFVLFGATGDLAMRKILPALFSTHRQHKLHPNGRIVCVSNQAMEQVAYLQWVTRHATPHIKGDAPNIAASDDWASFLSRITYVTCNVRQAPDYALLAAQLQADAATVFYLATSPALFEPICTHLHGSGINLSQARIVLEKPLGHDLASSRVINDAVARVFEEDQIYRIDHYLGKESVQNLLALRFANSLFEPLWRRDAIEHVQLTIAEQIGVENRGEFYDSTGALRDMVQNHLLQLLCMVAMEPPTSLDANVIRDEKVRVLRALKPFTAQTLDTKAIRGQYIAGHVAGSPVPAYLDEAGVAQASTTESYIGLHAEIDNWRWAGVPFILRTGKRLAARTAEIVITFRPVPHAIMPLPVSASGVTGNRLVIKLQPEESIQLHCFAKQPGDGMHVKPVALDLSFDEAFTQKRAEAYERLLLDVIRGDLSLFVRRDEQEAAWHWVEPLLTHWNNNPTPPEPYAAGSWGPQAIDGIFARIGAHWPNEQGP